MSTKIKRILRAGLIIACVAAMGCTGTLVYAEPSTGELKEKTSGLQGELNNLNDELSGLGKEMDSISQQIEDTAAAMETTQARMDEAQKKGEKQYEDMKLRIKYMYEAGDTSFIELLCSAESMTDFLNKTDFIKNVSEYDRNMLQELQNTQDEIKAEGEKLKEQQESLQEMQAELESKRTTLESKISTTSSELSQYSKQLERAKAAEQLLAAQRQQEQQQAAAGNQGSGSTVQGAPDTPAVSPDGKKSLGNFRITHYCSCYYCSGGWGSSTSTGTTPTPGRTIAVDPGVIPYGSRVIINGHVYVAEDSGGAIKGNKIDIYVSDHATAIASGVYYAEVFLAD